jgi:hypothetical protein
MLVTPLVDDRQLAAPRSPPRTLQGATNLDLPKEGTCLERGDEHDVLEADRRSRSGMAGNSRNRVRGLLPGDRHGGGTTCVQGSPCDVNGGPRPSPLGGPSRTVGRGNADAHPSGPSLCSGPPGGRTARRAHWSAVVTTEALGIVRSPALPSRAPQFARQVL